MSLFLAGIIVGAFLLAFVCALYVERGSAR